METQHGAEQAVGEIYATYGPMILRYLRRLIGSQETAEDLLQDTFIKALQRWEQLKTRDHVRAWLFRIATNTAYDTLRRQRRCPTTPLTALHLETLVADSIEPSYDELTPIWVALRRLPRHHRQVLLLQSFAGCSINDIVALLGWKEGTVKSRLHRARLRLRALYTSS